MKERIMGLVKTEFQRRNTGLKEQENGKKKLCKEIDKIMWRNVYKIFLEKIGRMSELKLIDKRNLEIAKEMFPMHKIKKVLENTGI